MTLTTVNAGMLDTPAQYTGFKNRIINGDMRINQRAISAQVPLASGVYLADRWFYNANQSTRFNAVGATTSTLDGFSNYLSFTSVGTFSPAAGDWQCEEQVIEGFNIADFGWGTVNAKAVTLSFRINSSLTGTFSGAIVNGGTTRSYPFTFSIPVANTWTTISVTIAGDTTGTWATDNTAGLRVRFNLGTGTTYLGTAGSWAGTQYFGVTGSVNVSGTSGATFYITGVQLEKGSTATSFDYRDYGRELIMCQRYLPVLDFAGGNAQSVLIGQANATTSCIYTVIFPVQTRTPPTSVSLTTAQFNCVTAAGGLSAISAIGFNSGSIFGSAFSVTTSGLVGGNASALYANTNAAKILWNGCEL